MIKTSAEAAENATSSTSNGAATAEVSGLQGRSGEQQIVGTPLYTAPEMFTEQESSTAMDIWALGCIIYQMHVGKTPFFGRSLGDIYLEVQSMQIEYPQTLS